MLQVDNIHTYYGSSHILQGISLDVAQGRTVALLGRNGAGKTTTLKTIMGILRPKRGSIKYRGITVNGMQPFELARLGMGFVPEDRRIFPEFTVLENLEVTRQNDAARQKWDTSRVFQLFPKLEEIRYRKGNQLSGGEQQMLAIARALMGNPQCLLLDEPSEGLAPLLVAALVETVNAIKKDGVSILVSEQNSQFCAQITDRAYIIDNGKVVFEGTMDELMKSEEQLRRHLVL
jgi:branched-chain amino acid transport system ATP-binding protein